MERVEPTRGDVMALCGIEGLMVIPRGGCYSQHQKDMILLYGIKHAGNHDRPDHGGFNG